MNTISPSEFWSVFIFTKDKKFASIFSKSVRGCTFGGHQVDLILVDHEDRIDENLTRLSANSLIHIDVTKTNQKWLEALIYRLKMDEVTAHHYFVIWAKNPWHDLPIHFIRDNQINDIRSKLELSEQRISFIIDANLRNQQQFLKVKLLKENFEQTIEERTHALIQLNKKLQSAVIKNSNVNNRINQQRIQIELKNKEIEERNEELEKSFKKSSIQHIKLYKALNENEQQRRNLEEVLDEIQLKNEKLQAQNEEIIAQRDQIELQNEEIQSQRDLAIRQRDQIALQQEEIQDNIQYASYMQKALLPPTDMMEQLLPEHFILNRPKDIVSGDFYWIAQNRNNTVIAVADCTGHGISGAMMSMLGTAFLNEIVNKNDVTSSTEILEHLRERIITSLHQQLDNNMQYSRDGMDISLCIIDIVDNQLEFSGANNPVYLIRKGELIELKPDKMPIGIHDFIDEPFTSQQIELESNDLLYMFTDGFADQFGGKRGKKLKYARFKDILLSICNYPLDIQQLKLEEILNQWQGLHEQIDDIMVFGYKIN